MMGIDGPLTPTLSRLREREILVRQRRRTLARLRERVASGSETGEGRETREGDRERRLC
jgi:hypothetical protein